MDMNHQERSNFLKKKYNFIKDIPSVCPKLKYDIVLLFLLSLVASYLSLFVKYYFLYSYFLGGILMNSVTLGMHEVTHYHAFSNIKYNRYLSIICDLSFGLPISESFRRYHRLHHLNNGVVGLDPDLPSDLEIKYFKGKLGKLLWIVLQGFFYSIRPLTVQQFKPTNLQLFSGLLCLMRFIILYNFFSLKVALFTMISLFIGTGLHPLAGHFITEHFYHTQQIETCSYYGWMNKLTFNVGYHVEHHDFPNIPGSYLPYLHNKISEYKKTPNVSSWVGNMIDFIIDDKYTLNNRYKLKKNT